MPSGDGGTASSAGRDAVAVPASPNIAFVFGGGGIHGAVQVGMLRALAERAIVPDLILGTSVGALNGVMLAADPTHAVDRLEALWGEIDSNSPFEAPLLEQAATIARSWTHLHGNHRLRRLLLTHLVARDFAELAIPFACVAASIERATAQWFDHGPLIPALLATTAVPGLLPPVAIGDEHFLDGGLVDSIPVGRAIELGARTVFVLQVGRIEQPLRPPARPWDVGTVAFEIARRHRFTETMDNIPPGIEVHVLPSGVTAASAEHLSGLGQLRYRRADDLLGRIDAAYRAALQYLTALEPADGRR
jgi:NTE family protein